jgi:ubiquinone/menaquinone biosynthesis C-methylase UbiE
MKHSAQDDRDRLALLAKVLLSPLSGLLEQLDIENLDLGAFIKQYASPPEPVDLDTRSSIREDAVIRELARLLADYQSDDICVLDVCCGVAPLAKRIMKSVGPDVSRVVYWAVDRDTGCIETVRAQQDEFASFRSFELMQRQGWDLMDLNPRKMDLIALNNALHEIPPRFYPQLFTTFNSLLNPARGRVCIVDMETLPADAPESIAIVWSGKEVQQFLTTAGFVPEVTLHEKQSTVCQVHVRHAPQGLASDEMRRDIQALLKRKLSNAIASRQKVEAALVSGVDRYREWVVLTGTIARCAEELAALGSY